jgi:hypothetical protein
VRLSLGDMRRLSCTECSTGTARAIHAAAVWCQSIRVLDEPALICNMTSKEYQVTKDTLFRVLSLFDDVTKKSARYKTRELTPDELSDP